MLYVSGGDGASFTFTDYGQDGNPVNPCGDPTGGTGPPTPPNAQGGALRSQDVRTLSDPTGLNGSILRVVPSTGAGAPGNPMASSTDAGARRIVAHGLRNPFRLTFRPGTSELWLGDVGWNAVEEIDRIPSPADASVENFGWPCYEGTGRQGGYDSANLSLCESLYSTGAVTAPYWSYSHSGQVVAGESCPTGSSSISGVAFYSGGAYPDSYDGAMFFADYSRRCIWVMFPGAGGLPDPATRATFLAGAAGPVDLQIGPGGDLFYVDLGGGTIRRIEFGPANRAPTAVATADPTSGAPPLTVDFDGSGSTDPDPGDSLTYAWDLDGDGAFDDSTAVSPTHTYTTAGVVTARLRVTDESGASSTASVNVTVGSDRPTATITSPAAGTTWAVDDVIAFSGSATDPQDGTLPTSALSWAIVLHHCDDDGHCHEHPLQTVSGGSGSFSAPDHSFPSYLELVLTATDSSGLRHTVSRRLDPRTVALTLESEPSGLALSVGSDVVVTPATRTVIVGSTSSIGAPATQTVGSTTYEFASWSDGGGAVHEVVAGTTPSVVTARYRPAGAPPEIVYRVNAGGPSVAGTPAWSADTGTAPSPYVNAAAIGDARASVTSPVDMTHASVPSGTPSALLQSERYDREATPEMAWRFPVTEGRYEVRLYFAETYDGASFAGARRFDVSIEGRQVLDEFDIFSAAGGADRAVVRSFVVDADTSLDVDFAHGSVENPKIDAIEVLRLGEQTAPDLGAAPAGLDFGAVPKGSSAVRQLTLTNLGGPGARPVTIDTTETIGKGAAWFSDSFDDAANVVLDPGESTTVAVTFAPRGTGARAVSLRVDHDGANSPTVVPLTGTGTASTTPQVVYRVNAGGPRVDGTPRWRRDRAASPSPFVNAAATGNRTAAVTSAIDVSDSSVPAGTPEVVFRSERYDPAGGAEMQWDFPVTAGARYEVRLYFAETFAPAMTVGGRVFDVAIEGGTVLDEFDVYAAAGAGNRGVVRSFVVTADANLDIDFLHRVEDPAIKAIEVLKLPR
jgi:PKD repeat protein